MSWKGLMNDMKHNFLEKLGVSIPQLGLGCMRLPTDNDTIDYAHAQKIVDYAMKNGVNYFDTAYMYHDGEAQYFLGKALAKYPRASYFLTNKLPIWYCKEPSDMEKIFQDQLQRCRTSYFDFYFMHSMNDEHWKMAKELGLVEFMKQKKNEGSAKAIGFSFHGTLPLLEEMVEAADWDFVQLQLNYLDWDNQNAKAFYEVLEKKGIPCFVMEPVRGGYLATLTPSAQKVFQKAAPERSMVSWAYQWLLSKPNVKVVLTGASSLEQFVENVSLFNTLSPLSEKEAVVIDNAIRELNAIPTVPCTGCRYCMECPAGVDIPAVFAAYNYRASHHTMAQVRKKYEEIPAGNRADACVSCRVCCDKCPQSIDIPAQLARVKEEIYAE